MLIDLVWYDESTHRPKKQAIKDLALPFKGELVFHIA